MEHKRISMVGVMASSGGSILAASAVLLSTSFVFANPGVIQGPIKDTLKPSKRSTGMDLPMTPVKFGDPMPTPDDPKPQPTVIPPPPGGEPDMNQDGSDDDNPSDVPPPTFFGEDITSDTASIVYVIDISGSMSIMADPFQDENDQVVSNGSRLDRAKAELKKSIRGLSSNFFFNVVVFDECATSCWSSKQEASDNNKANAYAWIDALQPDGWTNTGLAVQGALFDKDNQTVVLLSDGSPNFTDCTMQYVGTFDDHSKMIRSANSQNATINCFGIGIGSDPDAKAFMQRIAAENGGAYVDVN